MNNKRLFSLIKEQIRSLYYIVTAFLWAYALTWLIMNPPYMKMYSGHVGIVIGGIFGYVIAGTFIKYYFSKNHKT